MPTLRELLVVLAGAALFSWLMVLTFKIENRESEKVQPTEHLKKTIQITTDSGSDNTVPDQRYKILEQNEDFPEPNSRYSVVKDKKTGARYLVLFLKVGTPESLPDLNGNNSK